MTHLENGRSDETRRRRPFGLLLLLVLAGCGDSGPKASLSGVVTFDGKPVPGGVLKLVPTDANAQTASAIDSNGRYNFPIAPLGPVKFAVIGPGKPSSGDASAPAFNLPPRYADPEKSGLSYTVKDGRQTFDLKLTP